MCMYMLRAYVEARDHLQVSVYACVCLCVCMCVCMCVCVCVCLTFTSAKIKHLGNFLTGAGKLS